MYEFLWNVSTVIFGGVITLIVANWYHKRQLKSASEQFNILARFLDSFSRALLSGEGIEVSFTRDDQGEITNAHVIVSGKAAAMGIAAAQGTATTTGETEKPQ